MLQWSSPWQYPLLHPNQLTLLRLLNPPQLLTHNQSSNQHQSSKLPQSYNLPQWLRPWLRQSPCQWPRRLQ